MRYISDIMRQQVASRAAYKCEYCLIPEMFLATVFHIEHIRSLKHQGKTILINLAYACPHCNHHKGTDIATFLHEGSNELIALFNPRTDVWAEHFEYFEGQLIGISPCGIGTSRLLNFNQVEKVILRRELFALGLYP